MVKKLLVGWLAVLVLAAGAAAADAVELTLISAGAVRVVVTELADSFAKETGHSVKGTFDPAKAQAPDAARAFVAYVSSAAAKPKFAALGLDYRE
jgi:accessory colonization factor AcfC